MAIIENKIQYDWVRKRVSKLKERVDETTPLDNRYRIELDLLSKLEKEYSVEHAAILKAAEEAVISNIAKTQVNIYKGLPIVMDKINTVALAAVIGHADTWIYNKLRHIVIKGKAKEFIEEDLPLINRGLELLSSEIASSVVIYNDDREDVIAQLKELRKLVSMPYIYENVLNVKKSWIDSRMRVRSKEGKACSFKQEDIHQINMAAMQIANELKSTEFIL